MNIFTRIMGTCLAGAFLLAGCGGGGGYGSSPSTAGINGGGAPVNNAPINGGGGATPAFAKGAITQVAPGTSVTINGTTIATTGAAVSIDGVTGTTADLKVGQVVTLQGTVSTAGAVTATSVSFNNEIEGQVTSIDLPNLSFVVLGQTIRVTGATVFDNSSMANGFADLAVGRAVEVSGYRDSNGVLAASRIEKRDVTNTSPFELNGVVSGLSGSTFNIGTQSVSFAGVTPTNGTVADGVCVEVKGSTFSGAQLIASSVEVKSCGLTSSTGASGEIEGYITTFVSASDFSIGAQRVITTGSVTLVTNGANSLGLNVKVEAEGSFDASGNLVATKIEIKADNSLRLLGLISTVTPPGTIVVNGVTVQLSAATRMEDKSSASLPSLQFGNLSAGTDYVEVRGWAGSAPNTIAAMILERDNPQTRYEIQGLAATTANNTTTLTILGVTVDTTGATFRDLAGASIPRATFFAQPTASWSRSTVAQPRWYRTYSRPSTKYSSRALDQTPTLVREGRPPTPDLARKPVRRVSFRRAPRRAPCSAAIIDRA